MKQNRFYQPYMKRLKFILTIGVLATALSANAQTHAEGAEYYRADQFDNAKELLLRNLNNAGTDKSISNFYLGMIALRNGELTEAKKNFETGLTANPNYAMNRIGLGAIALKEGNEKGANEQFKMAEKLNKKNPAVLVGIARAYYNADSAKFEKQIEKYLEKARKINMHAPDIYIFEGDRLADKKNWGEAGGMYEMAANYNPTTPEAYVKYANLFTNVNPDYAIRMLSQLIEKNPNSALGLRELANAYYNNRDYKNAVSHYASYVNNPNHFKQDEDRFSFLLFYSGDFQKGYDYATKILSEDPTNFTAQRYQFMNAAQLPAMKEKLLPMAEALYAAHEANPEKNKFAPIDYRLIAAEYTSADQSKKGVEVFKKAIAEMPDYVDFNKDLAMAYVEANDITGASRAYKQYLEKAEKPGYNEFIQQAIFSFYAAVENKADAVAMNEFFNDCLNYVGKAEQLLPDNYKPKKIKGDVAKQKATEEEVTKAAAPMYLEAVKLLEASENPAKYASDAKEMYNYLGNYYLDQKDVAKAIEYFNKYLQYDPNNADYRKFVESLKQ